MGKMGSAKLFHPPNFSLCREAVLPDLNLNNCKALVSFKQMTRICPLFCFFRR